MARTVATLPAGSRISDYISLGVIAKFFPAEKIHAVLKQTNRASIRERDLPAHVVIYYVIALALYMRSSYREVLRCLPAAMAVLDLVRRVDAVDEQLAVPLDHLRDAQAFHDIGANSHNVQWWFSGL